MTRGPNNDGSRRMGSGAVRVLRESLYVEELPHPTRATGAKHSGHRVTTGEINAIRSLQRRYWSGNPASVRGKRTTPSKPQPRRTTETVTRTEAQLPIEGARKA